MLPRKRLVGDDQFTCRTNGSPDDYNDSKDLAEKSKDQYHEYPPSPLVHSIYSELHDALSNP